MLQGPYTISQLSIVKVQPGVYAFSKDGKTAAYIGRADFDLSERIRASSAASLYSYFWFEHVSTAAEAHDLECRYVHQYKPPENQNHPAPPAGRFRRCPICGK